MNLRRLDRTRGWFVIVASAAFVASCGADEVDAYLVVRGAPAALDAEYLYYFKNDSREPRDLVSYRKTTGEQRALGNFDGGGGEIAVADGFVITNTTQGTIRVPVGGGPPETVRAQRCRSIQVDDHTVYCVADLPSSSEVLIAVPLSGGAERVVVQARPVDYVVNRGEIFWSSSEGRLSKTEVATGRTMVLATAPAILAIAVDESDVYFTDIDRQTGVRRLHQVPRSGGAPLALGEIGIVETALAVDGRHVYWSQLGVYAARKDRNGAPFMLGSSRAPAGGTLGPPRSILVDDSHVYWCDGQVRRVEKPQ